MLYAAYKHTCVSENSFGTQWIFAHWLLLVIDKLDIWNKEKTEIRSSFDDSVRNVPLGEDKVGYNTHT